MFLNLLLHLIIKYEEFFYLKKLDLNGHFFRNFKSENLSPVTVNTRTEASSAHESVNRWYAHFPMPQP